MSVPSTTSFRYRSARLLCTSAAVAIGCISRAVTSLLLNDDDPQPALRSSPLLLDAAAAAGAAAAGGGAASTTTGAARAASTVAGSGRPPRPRRRPPADADAGAGVTNVWHAGSRCSSARSSRSRGRWKGGGQRQGIVTSACPNAPHLPACLPACLPCPRLLLWPGSSSSVGPVGCWFVMYECWCISIKDGPASHFGRAARFVRMRMTNFEGGKGPGPPEVASSIVGYRPLTYPLLGTSVTCPNTHRHKKQRNRSRSNCCHTAGGREGAKANVVALVSKGGPLIDNVSNLPQMGDSIRIQMPPKGKQGRSGKIETIQSIPSTDRSTDRSIGTSSNRSTGPNQVVDATLTISTGLDRNGPAKGSLHLILTVS